VSREEEAVSTVSSRRGVKPLKRLIPSFAINTRLKPGANESRVNVSRRDAAPKLLGAWSLVLFWSLVLGAWSFSPRALADSTVVFNELMFHPATSETNNEWFELKNQMAVDMDISGWRVTKGVEFTFPEGTIVNGGGYLIVAISPATLSALGVTNVLGPFSGRLSNNGDTLELRNNNNRLMDSVNYGVEGDWPVGPDGAGPSLSKIDEDTAGDKSENWRASELNGGTPGRRNFPLRITNVTGTIAIPANANWRYNAAGIDLGTAWRDPGYDDSGWSNGAAAFYAGPPPPSQIAAIPTLFNSGVDSNGLTLPSGSADPHYTLTYSAQGGLPVGGAPATVMANHPAWLANDSSSSWIGAIAFGSANVAQGPYTFTTVFNLAGFNPTSAVINLQFAVDNDLTNVLLNGASLGISYAGFSTYSGAYTVTNGFLATTNTLEFRTLNASTSPNPGGFRVKASGTALQAPLTSTSLPLGPTTYYFRKTFVVSNNPALTGVQLRSWLDDGAVFHINGVEVLRQNMPGGVVSYGTFASTSVVTAAWAGPFNVANGSLVSGTNVLAVEVHQASTGMTDMLFNAELTLLTTNLPPAAPPALALNEISAVTNAQFTIELFNYGATPVALNGYVLARFGNTNSPEYLIPSQTLAPGAFLVLDRATLGFGADPGDRVVLFGPGRSNVLDAIIAKSFPRARFPDGLGDWMAPTTPTFGSSNNVVLRNEIVINEIMYSHRELPPVAATYFTNVLVTITNGWRFNQTGADLGTAWRATNYDDSLWPTGKAMFWIGLGTNYQSLRNTTLALSNPPTPLTNYLFRTTFVITNNPTNTLLNLRYYVDDGAVFFLNGEEIHRFNISANPPVNTSRASANLGLATNTGPVVLSTTNFVIGTNVLAVSLHQAIPPPTGADVVFAAELTATGIQSPALPARESAEQWIELFNRGSNAVDLTGWRLDKAVNFKFPSNTVLNAGAYIVVTKDSNYLRSLYPAIPMLGDYSGKLSHSGEPVILRDPADNIANRVRYHDGRPWPPFADGAGSSMELRDPRADNSKPEAWADSNEGRNSSWQTYTYRGVAAVEPAASPTTQWKEFIFGMLGEGEVWLDDFSVIENPLTVRRQLLQNGGFENGPAAWRFLGNHRRATVITDPANGANHILRLVADGDTEHMHNQASTTLTNNLGITNGVEYEISFRAKWISGCNKLNTRLYFNRLPRTTELSVPVLNGTPGAVNSRYATNIGPTFANLSHTPVVPTAGDSVTVSVETADNDGIASATLFYSVNSGAWQSAPISVAGLPTSKTLSAILPAQATLSVVQFYIEATDGLGVKSTFPSGGTNSRALYAVGGQTLNAKLKKLRLIMPPADVAWMHASTNVMSNERFGCTVIADECKVFYDATMHLQGSERGRDAGSRVGFSVRLPAGELYRGVHAGFTVDRSGGYSGLGGDHDEILIKHAANKAGGLPGMYDDLAQVFAPRSSDDGTGLLILAKYGKVFLDSAFENGADGELHKLELIYYPTTTSTGDPQAPKLPQPDGVLGTDFRNLGDDAEQYRWIFLKENHVARDNYTPMVALAKAFDLSGQALDAQMNQLMDVDEWLRAVAFINLLGGGDIYSMGNSHNFMIYFRPEDGKAMAFLWDMDYSFVNPTTQAFPGGGSPNTSKLITTIPANHRRFLCHLYELTGVTGDSGYMNAWAARYSGLVGENWGGAANYLVQRATWVRSQLPLATPFAIANNGGNNFVSTNTQVTLTGTAPLGVKEIWINGVSYPITWTSTTAWSVLVPLTSLTNFLALQGRDSNGALLTNAMDSIVITNSGALAPVPVVINEWMASNGGPGGFPDPADGLFQDWIELFNPNYVPVNLSGFHLTDNLSVPNKWQIPTNTIIPARGFLLVWADGDTNQNTGGGDLHADFNLGANGESIGLYSTNLTPQHLLHFTNQTQNVSQGFYPDGNTNALYSMTNWTPRAANQLGGLAPPAVTETLVFIGTNATFTHSALPGRAYRVDYKNQLDAPAWTPLATNRAAGVTVTIDDTGTSTNAQRFYRVVLLQ
jgi:hypothetical protein